MASIMKYDDGMYRLIIDQREAGLLAVLLGNHEYSGEGPTPELATGEFYNEYCEAVGTRGNGDSGNPFVADDDSYINVYDNDDYIEPGSEEDSEEDEDE